MAGSTRRAFGITAFSLTVVWAAAAAFPAASPVFAQDNGTGASTAAPPPSPSPSPSRPPVAKVEPVTETFFGKKVTDDYRYMENLKDPYVISWFRGQATYTRSVLDRIPGRKALLDRIVALDNGRTVHVGLPVITNGYYFYEKRGVNDNIAKIYVRKGIDGPERLLIDPDTRNPPPGKHNAVDYFVPSPDGSLVAYGISVGGSENSTLHVVQTETGKDLPDAIDRAQFGGVSWLPDGKSFLYNRLQKLAPGAPITDKYQNSRVYLHALGSDPDSDRAIFGPMLSPGVPIASADLPFCVVQHDSDYVIGLIRHGVLNEMTLYTAPLASMQSAPGPAAIAWTKVCDVPDDVTGFDIHGADLYLLSHKGASRFQVLHVRADHPDLTKADVTVPPGEAVVTDINSARDGLYVSFRDGGIARLKRLSWDTGKLEDVKLPLDGSLSVSTEPRTRGALLGLTGWTRAYSIYAYDPAANAVTETALQPKGTYDAPTDLVSEEVKARAKDGTLIPLSIVYRRGLKRDGANPTWLDGYGAYGISTDPFFAPVFLAWLERGGVLAYAHVRGGGEYGEDWHLAGKGKTKPNTWNDFIACAQYLIQNGYTSPAKLSGSGTSAGGILIGRAVTTRPDLFGAACIDVGVSNPLRAEFGANGVPNIPEFGSVKTKEGFEALYTMDSLAHVTNGVKYPAVLLTTGINDPRVDSWEAGKMTARLQAATASGKPVLLRVDYDAGHGMGSTKMQRFNLLADELSFFLWQAGAPDFQPMP